MTIISTYDMFGREYQAEVEDLIPSVHVYGIAVQDGKVLVSPQFDGYDFPGGTFKLGEDTITTLKREFREETGYEVQPTKLLQIYTSFFHHPKRNLDYQSFLVFYAVKIVGGALSDQGFDEDEKSYAALAKWVKIADLRQMHHACSLKIADELLNEAERISNSA